MQSVLLERFQTDSQRTTDQISHTRGRMVSEHKIFVQSVDVPDFVGDFPFRSRVHIGFFNQNRGRQTDVSDISIVE